MVGRLCQATDFQRLLATPPWRRSAHFAIHHVAAEPAVKRRVPVLGDAKLSTGSSEIGSQAVDEHTVRVPTGLWMGCVVPKRHARRAVTRTLVKRQMRAAFAAARPGLAGGLWLLRLNRPFAIDQFPSAASAALRQAVRHELEQMFLRPASPVAGSPRASRSGPGAVPGSEHPSRHA